MLINFKRLELFCCCKVLVLRFTLFVSLLAIGICLKQYFNSHIGNSDFTSTCLNGEALEAGLKLHFDFFGGVWNKYWAAHHDVLTESDTLPPPPPTPFPGYDSNLTQVLLFLMGGLSPPELPHKSNPALRYKKMGLNTMFLTPMKTGSGPFNRTRALFFWSATWRQRKTSYRQ